MAGPNSAPNGDRRLVAGYPGDWEIEVSQWVDGELTYSWIPLRRYLAERNRLVTGKT